MAEKQEQWCIDEAQALLSLPMVARYCQDTYGCAKEDSCRWKKAGDDVMMSRRKQAKPQHIDNVQELASLLENGTNSSSDTDEDEHVCGKCRAEFTELVTFLQHKQRCTSKRPVLLSSDEPSALPLAEAIDEDGTKLFTFYTNGDLLTLLPKKYGDANGDIPDISSDVTREETLQPSHLPQNFVHQQIGTFIVKDNDKSRAPQLVALQTALSTLQQQQMVQLQVIQELQSQLMGTSDASVSSFLPLIGTAALTPPQSSDANPGAQAPTTSASAPTPSRTLTNTANLPVTSSSDKLGQSPSNTPLLPINEPNTLELLQRHTEQALQNTMAGSSFLLNGISGNSSEILKFRKNKPGSVRSDDPSTRHKCRFCGKVFGSDSSLQIHIRSHTGERPFKCNVCGNRFTTKGNLKVHFQRHKSKYPHIIMNSNPIPEYLDNLHPPLEPLSDSQNAASSSIAQQTENFSMEQGETYQQEAGRLEAISPPNISNSSDATEVSGEDSILPEDIDREGEMKTDPEDPDDRRHTPSDQQSEMSDKELDTEGEHPTTGSLIPSLATTSSPSFSSFFHAVSYAPTVAPPLCFAPVSGSGNKASTDSALELDPAFYQNLLPKPGTNDSSWESLMEITNPSETTKLQRLVDNIEHKLTDPNQCVICHRVLSCKSALQMHYRTHTGERPFKCKICGRAFTTKGNLKTHMGVHRVKPPVRVLHQCPICHKQFSNSLILQQHIRMHTGEKTDTSIQEIKSLSLLPPSFPRLPQPFTSTPNKSPTDQPVPNIISDSVIRAATSIPESTLQSSTTAGNTQINLPTGRDDKLITVMAPSTSSPTSQLAASSYTASLAALENQVKAITTNIPHPLPFSSFGMGLSVGLMRPEATTFHGRSEKSPSSAYSPTSVNSRPGSETSDERSTPGSAVKSESPSILAPSNSSSVITSIRQESEIALDLTPKTSCSTTPPVTDMMSKLLPPPLVGLPFAASPGRLNTTCKICFKTFACHSALEIHYRSHTKERPFKCNLCDRGFSTKGNMKQHMLTHRIRDLPSQLFSTSSSDSIPSTTLPTPPLPAITTTITTTTTTTAETISKPIELPSSEIQRSTTENSQKHPTTESPSSKRSPSVPKHFCNMCNKPFSSGSALQIHMRTHTGDKPFKCTVCGRAFTTKGNLKVHMGTHMWNNPTSRRGRRMSLELPLSPGRPGEFPASRPDVFFPYFPPGYLNGMNAPKMNEISVIQTAGLSNGNVANLINIRPGQQESNKVEDETDNRKSPARTNESSPTYPALSPTPPITTERPATWGWKIACNVCSKICSSSLELESHLKTHHYVEDSSITKELCGQSQ